MNKLQKWFDRLLDGQADEIVKEVTRRKEAERKERMKKRIISWLVWWINKVDPNHSVIKRFEYSWKLSLNQMRYVPDDGKWHHIAMTLESWVKKPKKGRMVSKKKRDFYVDGIIVKIKPKRKGEKNGPRNTRSKKRVIRNKR
jgi:hypothetical protein